MPSRATASFDVTGWDQAPYGEQDAAGPRLSRATVRKSFRGDLVAESTAELLMCQADPSDLSAGAGYVASELVTGRLAGREGRFVLQHWGVSDRDGQQTGGGTLSRGPARGNSLGSRDKCRLLSTQMGRTRSCWTMRFHKPNGRTAVALVRRLRLDRVVN